MVKKKRGEKEEEERFVWSSRDVKKQQKRGGIRASYKEEGTEALWVTQVAKKRE